MKLYHTTSSERADSIKAHGFRDTEGSYGFVREDGSPFYIRGVFLSDAPLGPNDGLLDASQVFVIEIPERMIGPYELIEEGQGKGYREWCVPAEVVNKYFSKRLPLGLYDLMFRLP